MHFTEPICIEQRIPAEKRELSSNSPPPWQSQSEASFTVAVDKGRALRAHLCQTIEPTHIHSQCAATHIEQIFINILYKYTNKRPYICTNTLSHTQTRLKTLSNTTLPISISNLLQKLLMGGGGHLCPPLRTCPRKFSGKKG